MQIIEPLNQWKQKKDTLKRNALLKGLWAVCVLCCLLMAVFSDFHSFELLCVALGGGVALSFMRGAPPKSGL